MKTKHPPLPPPCDLGFAPKFASWHDAQVEAIDRVVFSDKRFYGLNIPTGGGKSGAGLGIALLHPKVKRALYLTSTKGLEDQLAVDGAPLGLLDVRGQRNYPCRALEPGGQLDRYRRGRFAPTCDEGPCHSGLRCTLAPNRKEPNIRPDCAYYGAVWDARGAQLVSTNYAMYLTSAAYAEGLGDFDLLILDEAHDTDKELEAFLTLEITGDDCRLVGSKFLKGVEDLHTWKDWATHHRGPLASKLEQLELMPPQTPEEAADRRKLKTVFARLDQLSKIDALDWILDSNGTVAKFAPRRVAKYAEEFLFRGIPHVVLMSATLTRKTMNDLGIDKAQYDYWECPSSFDVRRRPIYSVNTIPTCRVNYTMSKDDKYTWLRRIDRIIETRRELGWKGIIHTVSYQRMRDLVADSEHKDLFVIHDSAGTKEAVKVFKEADGPRILVSPSMVTGYDFAYDQCQYQIIAKVPFPDMSSAIMKVRKEYDKDYGNHLTMQKLIQACGRGMRAADDFCEVMIVDDHFEWFFSWMRKHGCPKWFVDAVEYVDSIPEPLLVDF